MFKNPKGSPLSVFRHCETFFRKFVFSPKGSSFNCNKNVDNFGSVLLLARQGLALAGRGAPLSPFFWFFEKKFDKISKKNFKFFFKKSLLRFLSRRYGADFRRSRLVIIQIGTAKCRICLSSFNYQRQNGTKILKRHLSNAHPNAHNAKISGKRSNRGTLDEVFVFFFKKEHERFYHY